MASHKITALVQARLELVLITGSKILYTRLLLCEHKKAGLGFVHVLTSFSFTLDEMLQVTSTW